MSSGSRPYAAPTTVRRLLTGHSSFLSSPAEVAKLITTAIAEAAPAR